MQHAVCYLLALGLAAGPASAARAQSFAPPVAYSAGTGNKPTSLAVGDLNNDGYPDVATTNSTTNAVSVLLNARNGTFNPAASYSTGAGSSPQRLALGDVNQDGYRDLVVVAATGSAAVVLLNQGNGTFGAAAAQGAGPGANSTNRGVTVADVSGDNYPDILTVSGGSNTGSSANVLLNARNGTFTSAGSYPTGFTGTVIVAGDLNNDNAPDLAVADYYGTIWVLLNAQAGTFAPSRGYSAGSNSQPVDVALGDLNGDGYADLVTASLTGSAGVLLNDQRGAFLPARTYTVASGGYTYAVALGDVNGDGYPDLATANTNLGTISVLLNQGTGAFGLPTTYAVAAGGSPYGVALRDVNQDNRPDLVVADNASGTVAVLLNTTPLPTRAALPGATAGLAPNPAEGGTATLTLAGLPAAVARVQATLLDATGRAVARHLLPATQGTSRAEVPTAGLPAGLYVLRLAALDARGAAVGELPAQRLSVR